MNARICGLVLACAMSVNLQAQTARGVPTQLFGVTLGKIYDAGPGNVNGIGDLPVANFAGMKTSFGYGVHYYFKPKSEHKAFPYVEKRKAPTDEFFETSFRLYLLPVVPATVKTFDELEKSQQKWEVGVIEWSDDAKTKEAAYYWARDLCKTFEVDIGSKPIVYDSYAERLYTCTFVSGDREFEVRSLNLMRIVALSFTRGVAERKEKAVDTTLRKLQANEIRPY